MGAESKSKLKFENHISAHSNVDLNGYVTGGGGSCEKLKTSSTNADQEVCNMYVRDTCNENIEYSTSNELWLSAVLR